MLSATYNDRREEEQENVCPNGKYSTVQLELMQTNVESQSRTNMRHPFTTIDDLINMADELTSGLHILGERKHPLAVRKARVGRKEVNGAVDNKSQNDGEMMKGSWRTYFFDIKENDGQNPKKYLVITESRKAADGKFDKHRIMVYADDLAEFVKMLGSMESRV